MQRLLSTTILYFFLGAFIVGWWILAFPKDDSSNYPAPFPHSQTLALKTSQLLQELPLFNEIPSKAPFPVIFP